MISRHITAAEVLHQQELRKEIKCDRPFFVSGVLSCNPSARLKKDLLASNDC